MIEACPSARALSDAFARGDPELAHHAERCRACGEEWAALLELRGVARAIPYRPMSPERIRAVRAGLVMAARSSTPPSSRRAYLAIAAGALLIALGFGAALSRREEEQRPFLATLTTMSGDRPRRVAMMDGGVRREVVTLLSGRMDVEVAELTEGERFLVITDDAEVEVRGTRFEVEAQSGTLREVKVISGLVEVRPRGRATALLGPGERWIRVEPIVAPPQPAPEQPLEPKPAVKRKPKRKSEQRAAREPTPAERAFREGWSAYREGRAKEAAAEFERVMELAPGTPIAEDAAFWRERALGAVEAE
jgi:ferric-dicitrate binding protein FerR (iron transport regulator)